MEVGSGERVGTGFSLSGGTVDVGAAVGGEVGALVAVDVGAGVGVGVGFSMSHWAKLAAFTSTCAPFQKRRVVFGESETVVV